MPKIFVNVTKDSLKISHPLWDHVKLVMLTMPNGVLTVWTNNTEPQPAAAPLIQEINVTKNFTDMTRTAAVASTQIDIRMIAHSMTVVEHK